MRRCATTCVKVQGDHCILGGRDVSTGVNHRSAYGSYAGIKCTCLDAFSEIYFCNLVAALVINQKAQNLNRL